jgi:YjbE family integral membrane protein
MPEFLLDPNNWIALLQIIGVNIILSGDNAVVIALACRSLPPDLQKKGILFGSAGAILCRVVLTFFAVYLLEVPFLKLVGAALLLWIGVKLLLHDDGEGDGIESHSNLKGAIRTIIIADVVMSLDNVLGVAAAANGNVPLIITGLLISIPLIIFGSAIIMKLMERFPIIVTLGAALLGYVAGEMAFSDPAIKSWATLQPHHLSTAVAIACAVFVVGLGTWLSRRAPHEAAPLLDLAQSANTDKEKTKS